MTDARFVHLTTAPTLESRISRTSALPKPFSSHPTQWLFDGHPKGSDQPLHVAIARLLGYRNHWLEAALRIMLLLAANKGFAGIAWLPGKFHAERFPWANAEGLTMFYDRIVPAAVEKLAKSWGVQLRAAQFPTLSRHFRVRKVTGAGKWRVLNVDSGQFVGDEFSNQYQAEAFRRSKESPVLESVPAFCLSEDMRADIRKNGLPYLGAVGKRSVTIGNQNGGSEVKHR